MKYALDFILDGKKYFEILSSSDGRIKIWKCCNHNSGNCNCGLGFGNQIRIYSHLSKIYVKNDQEINRGNVIGIAGKSRLAGNVHLHWTLGKKSRENKALIITLFNFFL